MGAHIDFALQGGADGGEEFGGACGLVDEAGSTGVEDPLGDEVLALAREDKEGKGGMGSLDFLEEGEDAFPHREEGLGNDEIGRDGFDEIEGFVAGGAFPGDLEIGILLQQLADSEPHDGLVVDEQDLCAVVQWLAGA